jgi:hypothetical protein
MPGTVRRGRPEGEERRTIYLEFVAATAIVLVIVMMLYLMLTFKTT